MRVVDSRSSQKATRTAWTVLAAVVLVLVSGCGGADPVTPQEPSPTDAASAPAPSAEPSTSATPAPGETEDLLVTPPGVKAITVRGTVDAGVEAGCLVLAASGKVYNLLGGDRSVVQPGASVEVTGYLRPDVATLCQQGVPLQVLSARTL